MGKKEVEQIAQHLDKLAELIAGLYVELWKLKAERRLNDDKRRL